jgi:hypothetical protein
MINQWEIYFAAVNGGTRPVIIVSSLHRLFSGFLRTSYARQFGNGVQNGINACQAFSEQLDGLDRRLITQLRDALNHHLPVDLGNLLRLRNHLVEAHKSPNRDWNVDQIENHRAPYRYLLHLL